MTAGDVIVVFGPCTGEVMIKPRHRPAASIVARGALVRAPRDGENRIGSFTDRPIAEINDADGRSSTATAESTAARLAPFTAVP